MRPIATNGVASSVCLSVYVLVTFVSRVKTDESIEMPFGGWLSWSDSERHYGHEAVTLLFCR